MSKVYTLMSTGLEELDDVIRGIRPGDNIVWQLDSVEDYIKFVHPFCTDADKSGKKLVYFRFAEHDPVVPDNVNADKFKLHPEDGFETFLGEIFKVIEKNGSGVFYVFDCLSELAVDWYSDRMLANFFMLTCPYLYDFDTVTYFALLRNQHSAQTINSIQDTAQVVIDHYKKNGEVYIQPLKVYRRHSKTIYMLHQWKDNKFYPVSKSTEISDILKDIPHPWLDFSLNQIDLWNRVFTRAQEIQNEVDNGRKKNEEYEKTKQRLIRMIVTREKQLHKLAEKYFEVSDLVDIGKHMIGTGLVGGKTVGMLLARAILEKDEQWKNKLESHDSFFIGSDVFYTYLIKSKCWWNRWKQKNSKDFLEGLEETKNRLLSGIFPEDIKEQFREVLNYFGQSPIIVRSSSLLEDAYGNSFSGKYESVFCANQGTPDERLEDFMNAVKTVYASTMSHEALLYRHQRELLERDEQMALLVQRVSGSMYYDYYFPHIAGVGFSYNLYVWDKNIDPKTGVVRLVFGLGTRAVNRSDDDYTRVAAVNDPQKRPEADFEQLKKYAQKKVDIINLESNKFESNYFSDIMKNIDSGIPTGLFTSRDTELERFVKERNMKDTYTDIVTFDKLFSDTDFIEDIGKILKVLEKAYDYPVDIEFAANFSEDGKYKINLLQCRPYQVKKGIGVVEDPGEIADKNLVAKTCGPIIGLSTHMVIDILIYVIPVEYGKLSEKDRYIIANIIGKLTNYNKSMSSKTIMLLGPGRWGTTTPSLGVPVQLGEINNVSVLCEIAEMHEGLVPDVSLGTHFFNDLVELDILYMAIYPDRKDNLINRNFLNNAPNQLEKLLPEDSKWSNIVNVIDFSKSNNEKLLLNVNSIEQRGLCYIDKNTGRNA